MSNRRSSSRRKTYARRQHELHERYDRRHLAEPVERGWREPAAASAIDPLSFLDPRLPRLRFSAGA